jgi:hypothetical protein
MRWCQGGALKSYRRTVKHHSLYPGQGFDTEHLKPRDEEQEKVVEYSRIFGYSKTLTQVQFFSTER